MAEESDEATAAKRRTILSILLLIPVLIGVIVAIPIVYVQGRNIKPPESINATPAYVNNECTQATPATTPITFIENREPFPYLFYSHLYRPSVILKQVSIIFGFRHDNSSWSIDNITVVDTTTLETINKDGDFESNYLRQSYTPCILSSTRSSTSDILFDLPYAGDFYYNDQTNVGMTYLIQAVNVIGGRYYNISYYLENRGYPNNTFILLVGA